MPDGEIGSRPDVWFGGAMVEGVVFPVEHRSGYGDYCGRRRFVAALSPPRSDPFATGSLFPHIFANQKEAVLLEWAIGVASLAEYPAEIAKVGEPNDRDPPFWDGYYGGAILTSSFMLRANREADRNGDLFQPESYYGVLRYSGELIESGPDAGRQKYEGHLEAIALANRIALDHIGWRIAGSDDYYAGTPYYLFDAHDDTILFDYSATNGVGMRVCPVPRNHKAEQELLHASQFNCAREVLSSYSTKISGTSPGSFVHTSRPVYADGTVGPPCFISGVATEFSSCNDLCRPGE